MGFVVGNNKITISHLQYADDTIPTYYFSFYQLPKKTLLDYQSAVPVSLGRDVSRQIEAGSWIKKCKSFQSGSPGKMGGKIFERIRKSLSVFVFVGWGNGLMGSELGT